MIKKSFLFLPNISYKKELEIKTQVKDWDNFLNTKKIKGISELNKKRYDKLIIEAKNALLNNDSSFFLGKLKHKDNWLLYDYFKDESIFLDIEVSKINGFLTLIGLFDGYETKIMIKEINFDINFLKNYLKNFKLIITFNGSVFDLPFLEKKYPGLLPKVPNIDVRHLCQKLNLKGSLKEVELKLGIKRQNPIVERLYSGDPYRLWKTFKATGNKYYLDLLIEYNEEDIINLKKILDLCLEKLKFNY
ncbi:MAG: ribonuclease H-like domain-containing protein [Candidatus Woesearchaeota archaeon]